MDESRTKALLSSAKVRLILGPPGVGKTYFGCQIAEHELDTSFSSRPGKILFLTFARNAVARIREAYMSRIANPDDDIGHTKQLRRFHSRVELNTFAGFFWWLNEAYGRYAPGGTVGRPWLVSSKRSTGISIPAGHIPLDFGRLETGAASILGIEAVRALISELYPLIIIDEHQDVHAGLHDILILLGEASRLVFLHGPGQCIYAQMKRFDPAAMLQLARQSFRPEVFTLAPLGEGQQRHRNEIASLLDEYDAGKPCHWDGVWTRRMLVSHLTRNGRPNELETNAIRLVQLVRSHLQSTIPNQKPTLALLASTNSGAIDLYRRLRTGTSYMRPMAGTLVLNDLLVLHYGRLLLELLGNHWIAARPSEPNVETIADLIGLLFEEAGNMRPTDDWRPLAGMLIEQVQRQRPPGKNGTRIDKLRNDLSQVNTTLRATKAKLPLGSPSTPFTKADIALLDVLARSLIRPLEPLLASWKGVDLAKARSLFEGAMQQRIIFEKQGLEHGVQVMTIHKAKGREFDGVVVVLEDNKKALWLAGSATPDAELMDLYRVAISRPRSCLGVVAFEDAPNLARGVLKRLVT